MEYSYKFRLYPNLEQENLIQRTFGCARFVYNYFLAERITQYRENGKSPTQIQQSKELTALKQKLEWLQEPDKCALCKMLCKTWTLHIRISSVALRMAGIQGFQSSKASAAV